MRGHELEFLNLYEFIAIIAIIPLPKDKSNILEKSEDKQNENKTLLGEKQLDEEEDLDNTCMSQKDLKIRNLGRWNNKIYYFDDKYPVSTVKAMAIRSKFLIPKFVTSPPSFPTKLDNSIQSKNNRDRWALFILTHFKPWSVDTYVPCENPNWETFCEFLQSLVKPNQPYTNLSTILIILNIAHGLKVSNTRKRLQETWRARATKTWDELAAQKTLLRELQKTFPTKFSSTEDNKDNEDDDDDEHVDGIKYEHEDKRCENSLTVEEEYSTILMAEEKSHSKELQVQNYVIEAKNNYNDLLKNCIQFHKNKYALHDNHSDTYKSVTVDKYIKSTNDFSTSDETESTRIERTIELLKMDENMTENENVIVNTTTTMNDDVEQTYEMNLPDYDDVPDVITNMPNIPLHKNMLDNQQKAIFDKLYNLAFSNLNNYINDNTTPIKQELEVVLGGPGSGKSFLVKVLMHTLKIDLAERKREALLQLQDLEKNEDNIEKEK
jgi:hypothetical protein